MGRENTYTKETAWTTELRQIAMKTAERIVTQVAQNVPSFGSLGMPAKREVARLIANEMIDGMQRAGVYLSAGGGAFILGTVDKITLDGDKSKIVAMVRPGTTAVQLAELDNKQVAVVYTDVGTFDGVREELTKAVSELQMDFLNPDAQAAALANAMNTKSKPAAPAADGSSVSPAGDAAGQPASPPADGPAPANDAALDKAVEAARGSPPDPTPPPDAQPDGKPETMSEIAANGGRRRRARGSAQH